MIRFTNNKTITLSHTQPLSIVVGTNKFRHRSLIFHPIHTLKNKHQIEGVTNKAVPIEITQVTEDDGVVTKDLKGSGMAMETPILHAFRHPKFRTEDSIAVGHWSLDGLERDGDGGEKSPIMAVEKSPTDSAQKSPIPPKKAKTDDVVFSGKGGKKKRTKIPLNEFKII